MQKYIEQKLIEQNLTNVTIIKSDINTFEPNEIYDRILSIEMFEHLTNYKLLFEKLANWLHPDGFVFVHIFGHKKYSYPFINKKASDWIARHFFTGGIMPCENIFSFFENSLLVANKWKINGTHYQKTSNAWLKNFLDKKEIIHTIFSQKNGDKNAKTTYINWKIFFIACAQLFGYKKGTDYMVYHYLFKKKPQFT